MTQLIIRQQLQDRMAAIIRDKTGQVVEVTNVSATEWTISGDRQAVAVAVDYIVRTGLMTVDDDVFDDELNEWFVYLTTADFVQREAYDDLDQAARQYAQSPF